jgi:SpoVK/Ycf46/Vps4 family AAA+-type ATPase
VTTGDLGLLPELVEKSLDKVFALAERWKAILLIDEADIFLAKRTSGDLQRNSLVSGMYQNARVSST